MSSNRRSVGFSSNTNTSNEPFAGGNTPSSSQTNRVPLSPLSNSLANTAASSQLRDRSTQQIGKQKHHHHQHGKHHHHHHHQHHHHDSDDGDGNVDSDNNADDAANQQQQQQQAQQQGTNLFRSTLDEQIDKNNEANAWTEQVSYWFHSKTQACHSVWRRLMAIPTAFGIVHYVIPFTLELTILTLHFEELHELPSDSPFLDWHQFPRIRKYVIAQAIFGTLLAARFLLMVIVTKSNLFRSLLSAYGVVSMLTVPMMMYAAYADAAAAFSSTVTDNSKEVLALTASSTTLSDSTRELIRDGTILFSVPCVAAWRIWIVYDIIQTIIFASSTVSKSFRAIVFQLSFILTLFFTCMATMQLIFCVERGSFLDLGTSFYFTAATLTTVGYGDYAPTSVFGRAFIITQIFAAMLAVPLLLAETDRLMKFLLSLTGYAGSERHIIIFGELTETEFNQVLWERNNGDGKDDPLHLVFVANHFSQALIDRVAEGTNSTSITLCIASQLSRTELVRFSPQRADAALFFSSSTATSLRGDYRTIAAAASLKLHHPSLPQYLMMRRTDTAHLVEGAFVVFDRDFLRAALLGTSLQVPGFLPMFLNLIRLVPDGYLYQEGSDGDDDDENNNNEHNNISNVDNNTNDKHNNKDADHKIPTLQQQQQQQQQDHHHHSSSHHRHHHHHKGPAPKGDLLRRIQQRERELEKEMRRKEKPSPWYEMYRAGAKNNIYTITVPDELVGRTFVVASFIVQLRVGAIPIGLVRDSRVALNAGNTPITPDDSLVVIARSWEELFSKFSKFPTTYTGADTNVTKIALRSKEVRFETEHHAASTSMWLSSTNNFFPFHDHVILIDLASFVSEPELCAEESYQREQFQVQDMISLASRFPKWQSFVLLSLRPVSDLVQAQWASEGRQPMFHVRKSPLDQDALRLCRIGSCMSCLIFSSLSVTDQNDDTFRSAMLTINRRVMLAIQEELQRQQNPGGSQHVPTLHNSVFTEVDAKFELDQTIKNVNVDNNSFGTQQQQQQQNNLSGTYNSGNSSSNNTNINNNDNDNILQHPNVITVIGAPEEALLLTPEHQSLPGEKLEHDSHCTAYATGGALCPTILDGLMLRTYYNEYLPQIVELLLEPGAIHRERADILTPTLYDDLKASTKKKNTNTNSSSSNFNFNDVNINSNDPNNSNQQQQQQQQASSPEDFASSVSASIAAATASNPNLKMKYPTFGQICRVMTAGKYISFGFTRVIQTGERGADTIGKTFFVTNPDLSTPVMPDDYIFYLPQWSNERLAKDFFS